MLLFELVITPQLHAQNEVSKFLGKYLVKINEIDSAIYLNKVEGTKQGVITNYYTDIIDTLIISKNINLIVCKFGSFNDHVREHIAIWDCNNFKNNCIIDCRNIESDTKKIFYYLDKFASKDANFEMIRTGVFLKIISYYPSYPFWEKLAPKLK